MLLPGSNAPACQGGSARGRFADGRLIRTSDILRIELEGEFWVLHTYTGSFYVIASFHPGGYQSLVDYQNFLPQGFYPAPDRLH